MTDRVGNRRSVALEALESRPQGAVAGRGQFASDRIVVVQIERTQERLERQSLDYQCAEHDGERRQYDQVYRAQTAVRPVAGGLENPKVRARARSGSAGLGITLDVLGLRVGLALDAEARRGAARNLPRRTQRKKR